MQYACLFLTVSTAHRVVKSIVAKELTKFFRTISSPVLGKVDQWVMNLKLWDVIFHLRPTFNGGLYSLMVPNKPLWLSHGWVINSVVGAKPLSEPMLECYQLDPSEQLRRN